MNMHTGVLFIFLWDIKDERLMLDFILTPNVTTIFNLYSIQNI